MAPSSNLGHSGPPPLPLPLQPLCTLLVVPSIRHFPPTPKAIIPLQLFLYFLLNFTKCLVGKCSEKRTKPFSLLFSSSRNNNPVRTVDKHQKNYHIFVSKGHKSQTRGGLKICKMANQTKRNFSYNISHILCSFVSPPGHVS